MNDDPYDHAYDDLPPTDEERRLQAEALEAERYARQAEDAAAAALRSLALVIQEEERNRTARAVTTNAKRVAKTDAMARRAQSLRAEGMEPKQIAGVIGAEYPRLKDPDGYVHKLLRRKLG